MGLFVGPGIVILVFQILTRLGGDEYVYTEPWLKLLIYMASGIASGVFFLFLSKPIVRFIFYSVSQADRKIAKLPSGVIMPGVIGLILGLVVAYLLSHLFDSIPVPWISGVVDVVAYIVCVYLGISIFVRHKPEFGDVFKRHRDEKGKEDSAARPKLLDTSVIIDGRIFDICNSGIIEGALIIPEFVLDELRHIADSADDLKRNRGRRGLDVLNRIQSELKMPVKVVHADVEGADVDAKLLTLARDMDGVVVTNDFNLNKVAAVKNVHVLNINELANAVKPVVLPGEEMRVTIVKDGKEPGQGVAYLDDGTMVVVEEGQKETGRLLAVIVTSVLQTSAGRMIFAKVKQ